MLTVWLGLTLAAAPKLATLGVSVVNLPAELGPYYSQHLGTVLSQGGLNVTTQQDVMALLGQERQRQLAGCATEDSNCMAELAGAIGVDGLVMGDVAKLGDVYQVNVKVVQANGGGVLFTASERVKSEEEVIAALDRAAALAVTAFSAPGTAARVTRDRRAFIPLGVGAAAAIVGGISLTLAGLDYQSLRMASPATLDQEMALSLQSNGRTKQWVGVGFLVGGAVLVAAGLVWWLMWGAR